MKTDGKNVKWKSKEQREKENRRIRWIFLILFLLVLLGFGGMGYRVWKQYSKDLMQNQYDQLSNSSKILSRSNFISRHADHRRYFPCCLSGSRFY